MGLDGDLFSSLGRSIQLLLLAGVLPYGKKRLAVNKHHFPLSKSNALKKHLTIQLSLPLVSFLEESKSKLQRMDAEQWVDKLTRFGLGPRGAGRGGIGVGLYVVRPSTGGCEAK